MTTLLNAVRHYAEVVWATAPSGLDHAISRPLVCLVLQGSKHVTMGAQAFAFAAGDSLLITTDVPTVNQITRASVAAPYLSLVLELDPAVIADLSAQMKAVPVVNHSPRGSSRPMPRSPTRHCD
jgi:hypothetical protein